MHTVHLFPKGSTGLQKPSLCCGKKWAETMTEPGGHTHTTNPNAGLSPGGVWCKVGSKLAGIGVNEKGAQYTVHLKVKNGALCCAITKNELGEVHGHLSSTSPDWTPITNDMAKCPGWPKNETDEPVNPKLTCMICGWPRIPKGAGKKDGTALKEGEFIPQHLYIDDMLVKVFCEKHCPGCGQPTELCGCCTNCHKYPCKCGTISHPVKKAKASSVILQHATMMHVVPLNSKKATCCGASKADIDSLVNHDHVPEFEKYGLGENAKWCASAAKTKDLKSIHGFYFDLPTQYECYGCMKHMKNCECENGPVDEHGTKKPTMTTHEGKPVTIATSCMVPGWISRGQVPTLKQTDAEQAWPNMKPKEHDPVEWACDFYLYHAILSGGVNTAHECEGPCHHNISQMFALEDPPVRAEARLLLNQVITEADLVFREYIDMACGGELRHHPSVGPKDALSATRSLAWAQWRDVRDLVGVRALLDMAELFIDCNATTGGMCGQRWRQAALLLHDRLTGKVKPEVFVDQVFTLVHNGGVFLNKREWKNNRLALLQGSVLPAQAQDDFDALLDYASPTAVAVWDEAWRAMNYSRIRSGVRPARREILRSVSVCDQCGFASFQGHLLWDCRKASVTRHTNKTDIQVYRSRRARPHYDWNFTKFWLYECDGHNNGPYYRCTLLGTDYVPSSQILDATITIPDGKRTLLISDGDYNILKLPISKFKGQEWKIRDLIEIHGLKVSILDNNGMEVNT